MASKIQILILSSGYRDTIVVGVPGEPDYLSGTVEVTHAHCIRRYEGGGLVAAGAADPSRCTLDKFSEPGVYVAQLSKLVGRLWVDDTAWAEVLGVEL